MLGERIPLRRVKTMRNTISGKNILNSFLKEHTYKLSQISFRGSNLTTHPLRNIRDVSILGGWCPGGLAWHWGSSGGARWDVGIVFLQKAETVGNRDPTQRRRHSHPQLLFFVTGPGNYQVTGKHPFVCERCIISLSAIVPSELSSHSVTDEEWTITYQKAEPTAKQLSVPR